MFILCILINTTLGVHTKTGGAQYTSQGSNGITVYKVFNQTFYGLFDKFPKWNFKS